MLKKSLGIALVATTIVGGVGISANNVYAESPLKLEESIELIVPDKTEYITTEKGQVIPVIYISDPDKAEKYMKQHGFTRNNQAVNSLANGTQSITPMATYTYKRYAGTLNYDYRVRHHQNRTGAPFLWKHKFTRSAETTTSISVGASFKNVFEASIGKQWGISESFEDTFEVNIPTGKQGEIWSWNVAQSYIFSNGSREFASYYPTKNFGSSILITDYRDPVG